MYPFQHDGSMTTVCLVIYVTVAAAADLRCQRIPNTITVPAALLGVAVSLLASGSMGAVQSVAGLVVGLATFLPFYLLRGFGAGDVKAMAAVGAFLGPKGVLLAAGFTLACGALGAVVVLIASGGPSVALRRRFPYGLAIALVTVASLAWN